jgi:hypothetical protein
MGKIWDFIQCGFCRRLVLCNYVIYEEEFCLIGYLDQMYVYVHLYTHYCTAAKVLRSVPLRNAHSACLLGHNVRFMKPAGNDLKFTYFSSKARQSSYKIFVVTFRQGRLIVLRLYAVLHLKSFSKLHAETHKAAALYIHIWFHILILVLNLKIRVVLALSTEMKKYIYDEYVNILKIGI